MKKSINSPTAIEFKKNICPLFKKTETPFKKKKRREIEENNEGNCVPSMCFRRSLRFAFVSCFKKNFRKI